MISLLCFMPSRLHYHAWEKMMPLLCLSRHHAHAEISIHYCVNISFSDYVSLAPDVIGKRSPSCIVYFCFLFLCWRGVLYESRTKSLWAFFSKFMILFQFTEMSASLYRRFILASARHVRGSTRYVIWPATRHAFCFMISRTFLFSFYHDFQFLLLRFVLHYFHFQEAACVWLICVFFK